LGGEAIRRWVLERGRRLFERSLRGRRALGGVRGSVRVRDCVLRGGGIDVVGVVLRGCRVFLGESNGLVECGNREVFETTFFLEHRVVVEGMVFLGYVDLDRWVWRGP
jgi:hypothetical protein